MDRDTYADGIVAIASVLRPKFPGWTEIPCDKQYTMGYPARAYFHQESRLFVLSAVEVVSDGKVDKGPEFHLSVSRQIGGAPRRCSTNDARYVLKQFGLDGAEEDNHVPGGVVRNFWRPVAYRFVGLECDCKASEPTIVEDKGDFVWRG